MKRFFAVLLVFMFAATACAELTIEKKDELIMEYNVVADNFGAKHIDLENAYIFDETYVFALDTCGMAFFVNSNDEIYTGGVYLYDFTDSWEFLRTCMAIMTFLGDMNYECYGHLLSQFAEIKNGKEKSQSFANGRDTFSICLDETGDFYTFIYYNNDL